MGCAPSSVVDDDQSFVANGAKKYQEDITTSVPVSPKRPNGDAVSAENEVHETGSAKSVELLNEALKDRASVERPTSGSAPKVFHSHRGSAVSRRSRKSSVSHSSVDRAPSLPGSLYKENVVDNQLTQRSLEQDVTDSTLFAMRPSPSKMVYSKSLKFSSAGVTGVTSPVSPRSVNSFGPSKLGHQNNVPNLKDEGEYKNGCKESNAERQTCIFSPSRYGSKDHLPKMNQVLIDTLQKTKTVPEDYNHFHGKDNQNPFNSELESGQENATQANSDALEETDPILMIVKSSRELFESENSHVPNTSPNKFCLEEDPTYRVQNKIEDTMSQSSVVSNVGSEHNKEMIDLASLQSGFSETDCLTANKKDDIVDENAKHGSEIEGSESEEVELSYTNKSSSDTEALETVRYIADSENFDVHQQGERSNVSEKPTDEHASITEGCFQEIEEINETEGRTTENNKTAQTTNSDKAAVASTGVDLAAGQVTEDEEKSATEHIESGGDIVEAEDQLHCENSAPSPKQELKTLSSSSLVTHHSAGSRTHSIDLLSDLTCEYARTNLASSAAAQLAFPKRSATARYRASTVSIGAQREQESLGGDHEGVPEDNEALMQEGGEVCEAEEGADKKSSFAAFDSQVETCYVTGHKPKFNVDDWLLKSSQKSLKVESRTTVSHEAGTSLAPNVEVSASASSQPTAPFCERKLDSELEHFFVKDNIFGANVTQGNINEKQAETNIRSERATLMSLGVQNCETAPKVGTEEERKQNETYEEIDQRNEDEEGPHRMSFTVKENVTDSENQNDSVQEAAPPDLKNEWIQGADTELIQGADNVRIQGADSEWIQGADSSEQQQLLMYLENKSKATISNATEDSAASGYQTNDNVDAREWTFNSEHIGEIRGLDELKDVELERKGVMQARKDDTEFILSSSTQVETSCKDRLDESMEVQRTAGGCAEVTKKQENGDMEQTNNNSSSVHEEETYEVNRQRMFALNKESMDKLQTNDVNSNYPESLADNETSMTLECNSNIFDEFKANEGITKEKEDHTNNDEINYHQKQAETQSVDAFGNSERTAEPMSLVSNGMADPVPPAMNGMTGPVLLARNETAELVPLVMNVTAESVPLAMNGICFPNSQEHKAHLDTINANPIMQEADEKNEFSLFDNSELIENVNEESNADDNISIRYKSGLDTEVINAAHPNMLPNLQTSGTDSVESVSESETNRHKSASKFICENISSQTKNSQQCFGTVTNNIENSPLISSFTATDDFVARRSYTPGQVVDGSSNDASIEVNANLTDPEERSLKARISSPFPEDKVSLKNELNHLLTRRFSRTGTPHSGYSQESNPVLSRMAAALVNEG